MPATERPNRLAELRSATGLSQTALAYERGVTSATIYRWETGRVPIPDTQKLALALRFGVTPGYLMGWEPGEVEAA